ncbi:SDR family oxidoreductase [Paracoccus denitrificans]|jgi:NAD(P)H dehydrogenase (quinone)|uniref:NmrA family protein n=1 Tax=Paracoccus denitrificans (strain Pd 1222) TaxID=318586 RepID=A1BA14_PARDP|nr:SDR family oxidoreductase [Paracoccus denitrificans]ABL72358.1 NmrA family protein [Paracoccus denitrificans PD1222]MBB4628489.1 NAD(P)H dehydrogenase (quinone) [Paracoccus denitrificans]MCU7430209.1 SDR family oxidoreductase [Paracoccus denitrificans]QAR28921.1 SDR family oxidoreductase [Paracoccus denitrificans]UPV97074.1 SDR family oxidoreductase [Paracoccus denitrificans]
MTVAVTGATGQLGRLTIARLKTLLPAGEIVALARNPEKAADLGVEARAFDYDRPETLATALQGVDRLLLISSSEVGKRAAQHRAVIEAAKAAGVGQIVYTSLLHADRSPLSLAEEHVATEAMLAASGIPHAILRNGWYAENHTGAIPAALAHGALIGAAGEGRISAAARADYAKAAASVLADGGHAGQTYELAGDDGWTLAELAAELSAQSGKAIPYRNLSQQDYAAALTGAGLPEGLAGAIASWDTGAAQGALFDDSRTLSRLIGRPTATLAEVVRAAL